MTTERELAELPKDEALRLLASVPFGRVVFTARALPAVRPVNHLVDGSRIIIRTSLGSALSTDVDGTGTVVAYEADEIDPVTRQGWSVVVVGRALPVTDGPLSARYRQALHPWAAGQRDEVIAISTDMVTGYRLVPPDGRSGRKVLPGRAASLGPCNTPWRYTMSASEASAAPHHGRIVVGVDGSPISKVALRWAINQARLTGATVDAVIAWQIPESMTGHAWAALLVEEPGFGVLAEKEMADAISEVAGPDPDVTINPVVVQGWPAEVLLEAAEGADLLVVGSRGRGGFASALLGSVSQNCAHHATCPLLIIRAAKDHH